MAAASLPTPRPDEKVVVILEVTAPQVAKGSKAFTEFDHKFTTFKNELDQLVTKNFAGALKMKVLMKKDQQSSIVFRS